jgi:hypothetical protein
MPKLDDPLKERFAQLVASGECSKKDAYAQARMAAGDDRPIASITASTNASRLLKEPAVLARIEELTEFVEKEPEEIADQAQRAKVEQRIKEVQSFALTKQWVIDELVDNVKRAKKRHSFAGANKALELLGRHLGMFAEQIDTEKGKYVLRDRPLTADEWISKHADRSN